MSDDLNQPRHYDAVIGGQNPPPLSGAVLGGLSGVKRRMASGSLESKIAALKEALKYGQNGLNLLIQALNDPESEMQWKAYLLLKERTEPSVRDALKDYIPVIYNQLRDNLAAGKWLEADWETSAAMLKVVHREKAGGLRVEDLQRFPTSELRIIEKLWEQYSQGKFGFSIQKQIWQSVGNNYFKFGDRIGWRQSGTWLNYSQLTFATTAPLGHLPAAHLTWSGLKRGQSWQWYGGTEEDVRFIEGKSLLERRDF
ncbi:GUN4 domain-containing protein [Microseira sp. BLCC-F43]|uniref:GUN4 domain-containing protein n=1 Tax=Microseira sp. BLCC-F43 TaxID=3153602 RepID=UPI0035BABADA